MSDLFNQLFMSRRLSNVILNKPQPVLMFLLGDSHGCSNGVKNGIPQHHGRFQFRAK